MTQCKCVRESNDVRERSDDEWREQKCSQLLSPSLSTSRLTMPVEQIFTFRLFSCCGGLSIYLAAAVCVRDALSLTHTHTHRQTQTDMNTANKGSRTRAAVAAAAAEAEETEGRVWRLLLASDEREERDEWGGGIGGTEL